MRKEVGIRQLLFILKTPNIDDRNINPENYKAIDKLQNNTLGYQPPIVIIPLIDTCFNPGYPLNLACKIVGFPIPKVLCHIIYYKFISFCIHGFCMFFKLSFFSITKFIFILFS